MGCEGRRFLDGHHSIHWGDGGPTDPDHVLHLCYRHHVMVHEGGWNVRPLGKGVFEFVDPDGRVHDASPPRPAATGTNRVRCRDVAPEAVAGKWDGSPLGEYALDCIINGMSQLDRAARLTPPAD